MDVSLKDITAFIRTCGSFVVSTISLENKPNSRPFGAICSDENYLYIATNCNKNVYKEILNNNNILLYAIKPGTREWCRLSVVARTTDDYNVKLKLFEENKVLYDRYNGLDDPDLRVLKLDVINVFKY